ncbi:MAG: alpha/beta hydrolase, partial [Acidobacteriota bacterium]|nr:alpha/beta hydrolase [Acidobacteriota bacterium]
MKRKIAITLTAILLSPLMLSCKGAPVGSALPDAGSFSHSGVTLHYKTFGRGHPVLLLSGGPGFTAEPLIPTAQELAESHMCVLLDQRGTGDSTLPVLDSTTINLRASVEDLEALRKHLGFNRWTVLGVSWGGMLAMAYAGAYPNSVDGLILVDSGGVNLDFLKTFDANINKRLLPSELKTIAFWSDPSRLAADPRRAGYEILRAKIPGYFFDRRKAQALINRVTPESFDIRVNELMLRDLSRQGYDLRDALRSFEHPVLIVQGRQDPLGESTARQIHSTFPNSTLQFIEECG